MVQLKNTLLQQAEEKIESQIDAKFRDDYMKIVVAGLHVAIDKGPDGILGAMNKSKDPIKDCANGAIGLVFLMRKQAKGVMPTQALIPAAMTLMLKALDFASSAKLVEVGNDELVRATKIFADRMMKIFKVTPQMLKHAAGKVNQLSNDPAAVEKMKLASGVTQHPQAAKPTPLPEGGGKGMINGAA